MRAPLMNESDEHGSLYPVIIVATKRAAGNEYCRAAYAGYISTPFYESSVMSGEIPITAPDEDIRDCLRSKLMQAVLIFKLTM